MTSLIVFVPVERVSVFSMIVKMMYGIFRHCATFLENVFGESVLSSISYKSFPFEKAFCELKAHFSAMWDFSLQKLSEKNQNWDFCTFSWRKEAFIHHHI